VHPDDQARWQTAHRRAIKHGSEVRIEYRYTKRGTEQIWVRSVARPETDRHGRTQRISGIVQDITAMRAMAQQLAASEAKFRDLTQLSADWVWETDAEHRLSYLSDSVVAELGGPAPRRGGDRLVRVLAELGARDHRGPFVEQADEAAQQAGLALSALAEQHHVVPREQRPLELGDHRGVEAVDARPRVAALPQPRQQVPAELLAQVQLPMAAGSQLTECADRGCGCWRAECQLGKACRDRFHGPHGTSDGRSRRPLRGGSATRAP
jgi:PAS domain-containing protein